MAQKKYEGRGNTVKSFDNELKKAAEMYVNRTFESDIPSEISGNLEKRINGLVKEEIMKTNEKRTIRKGVKAALICAAVVGLSAVVCAAPAIHRYINMAFLQEDSIARLTEVPEGYIGIYTAEDLDNVRNNLTANYIMMNDIVITEEDYAEGGVFEGGFEPIGDNEEAFAGMFNGNGFVIDGLVIDVEDAGVQYGTEYIGLFGKCERFYTTSVETENGSTLISTEDAYGIVKNLGVRNVKFDIQTNENIANDLRVGVIAGHADFIAGCFAENVEIIVDNSTNSTKIYVGGLAGSAGHIDSCYVTGSINVIDSYDGDDELRNSNYQPYVGGIAGYSNSCVTSYFDGMIISDYESNGITTLPQYNAPWMLTEPIMDELLSRLDDWNRTKFNAFYVFSEYHFNEILTPQVYVTEEIKLVPFYVRDPMTKDREMIELDKIIEMAFPDGTFEQFCIENNLKLGTYGCYDLRGVTECDFDGFDFDSIWYRDGHKNPTLRLFDGGSKNIGNRNGFDDRVKVGINIPG